MKVRRLSLRARTLGLAGFLGGTVILASIALGTLQQREEARLALAVENFAEEQQLADRMKHSAMVQILRITDLGADDALLPTHAELATTGDEIHHILRALLDRPLLPEERGTLERLRESHQDVETAAARAIILSRLGDVEAATRARTETAVLGVRFLAELERFSALRAAELSRIQDQQRDAFRLLGAWRLVLAFALLVLFALLILFVYRRVATPLDDLLRATGRIRQGDLSARVAETYDPELTAVADGFNRMAEALGEARQALEERNRALARAVEEVQEAEAQAVQAEKMAALGRMAAGLAHELNNPLGAVLGFAELLDERLQEARLDDVELAAELRATHVAPILVEGARARDLIRTILQFSRRTSAAPERIRLDALVQERLERERGDLEARGIRLETGPIPAVFVHADPRLVESVVQNLVQNARDAIRSQRPEGGRLQVRGSLLTVPRSREGPGEEEAPAGEAAGGLVQLRFVDDGPGFADLDRVFEPFYTTKPPGSGTGLGLPLVQRFIEESGGRVTVGNGPDAGAWVEVVLPCTPVPANAAGTSEPVREPVRGPVAELAGEPLGGLVRGPVGEPAHTVPGRPAAVEQSGPLRILVVDDEEALCRLQARLLERLGHTPLLARSVEEARSHLLRAAVDAIVSDVRMPGESGVDLYRWVEAHRPHLRRHFLFLTGDRSFSELTDLTASFPEGGDPTPLVVLAKPFAAADYRQAIHALLSPGGTLPSEA